MEKTNNTCEYCGTSLETAIWKDIVVVKDNSGNIVSLEPISAEVKLESADVYDIDPVYHKAEEKYKEQDWSLLTSLPQDNIIKKSDTAELPYGLEDCGAHCKKCNAGY